jgi:formylmethanofuran dehydrogenase subunit E
MGYDVVNVGEKDLMMGLKFLFELSQKAKFPFISANLVDKNSLKRILKPYVIKDIHGLKIGIFGVLDDAFNQRLQEREPTLMILEPFSQSRDLIRTLKEHCDLIVALSQLGERKDRKLVMENPEIDLILGGGGESNRAVSERINGIPIYRLEPRGGYLGRIDYTLADMKKPIRIRVSKERDELERKLERVTSRTISLRAEMARSGKQEEMKLKELKFLELRQKELEERLFALQDENFYKHTAIPVQLSVRDDPNILRSVEAYRVQSAKLYKPKATVLPEKEYSEKEMIARIPKESPFVGAISCKQCHEENYRKWLKTKHAKASQTIISSPKYSQEECLSCHSTGYGKMGDYVTVEEIPFYLHGVQCEACHGEGRGHPEKGEGLRKVTLGVCRNCHTTDQSPAFNYMAYLEKIGCQISR